ncbi:MAG: chromosome segregation protein SMC [Pseudomonadota bacterium]|jgi:chromosome segregation protein|nr:chromosome segregation protein SMC [Rubrivivax sp.]MCA3258887.1 chromosome segregation protein SMC [Rubrivivax sp.]MCE2910617.1 chromosome segregation protein SMC [Rubrivivax sp.]MCZ8032517.1 chromosome segregation protein SMC [Rubrivivax sp.]
MRLSQIKLSGFKSFAEPTTFQLPGQRIGVVGPNGCGKSNIIDAVRWVLGESKASELRGESMQDVIFNGSGNRKPAGRASVELVFDNTLARAGGQWNSFAEIAVKRVLARDGTSSYYINNQPVRRRDVQDVFLGTGLGPRAYAIIGQGTISRIIESRPEELRLFLEEAAGVSKYKERRRETENRLKDTRENLTRVDDILRELGGSLDKLERQAEVAQRYRQLQDAGTTRLHQLWFLKHRDASSEETRVRAAVAEAHNALEARLADLRRTEAELEAVRQDHFAANDALHARQGALAEAQLEVSRLEERIRFIVDGRRRAEARLAELRAQNQQWAERQREAEDELERIGAQIADAEDQAAGLHAQAGEQGLRLPGLEDALRTAQAASSRQRNAVSQVQQQIQVLAAEGRAIDEQRRGLRSRRDRLAGERQGLQGPDLARLETLRLQEADASLRREQADAVLAELSEQLPALDEQRRAAQEAAARDAGTLADLSARLQALRALQDKVQTQGRLPPWLERHGLAGLQGLWKQVHVEPGWEPALEAALRERLHALAVGRLDTVRAFAADAPPARLAFYALPGEPARAPQPRAPRQLPLLVDLVRVPDAGLGALLGDWLEGVFRADSLEAALAARGTLAHGEVIMTREGHAVSQFAVCFYAPDSEQAGLLARAQEIENLERQQRAQQLIADESRAAAVRLDAAYGDAAQRLAAARREAAEAQNRAHALHVEVLRLAQQAEATSARHERIAEELAELDAGLEQLAEREATGQARFEELDLELASAQEQHAALDDAVLEAERALSAAREQQRALERQAQEASFQARALASRRAELQRGIETAAAQVASNLQAGGQLELELGAFDDAAVQSGLQGALALRVEREQELASARSSYDGLSARLKALDEQRLAHERSLDPMRERITRLQLEEQAAALGGAQFMEQLVAAGVDLAALEHGIAEGKVRLQGLQGEIDRIQQEIAELGAVNLAALEELGAARERKAFLDAQNADLQEAIRTLEDAIHRIDLETRELLASTFNQVNEHFGRMFPVLFGGGTARLAMTGAEILDAGVQVMAQPPGKRNSTIHLLSGGEKALTAIALVFAIFQLNPAPFCLLDEVDAPLDDANTERYARLVAQMSRETQFLFISHNKITMEMAEQLIGVTMQEQGVSRIVAVDIEAAVSLAEAA